MKYEELSRALEFLDEDLLLEADAARTVAGVGVIKRNRWMQLIKQPRSWISAACILLSVSLLAVTLLLGSMHGFYLGPLEGVESGETENMQGVKSPVPNSVWSSGNELPQFAEANNFVIYKGGRHNYISGAEHWKQFYAATQRNEPATIYVIDFNEDQSVSLFFCVQYDGTDYSLTRYNEKGEIETVEKFQYLLLIDVVTWHIFCLSNEPEYKDRPPSTSSQWHPADQEEYTWVCEYPIYIQ